MKNSEHCSGSILLKGCYVLQFSGGKGCYLERKDIKIEVGVIRAVEKDIEAEEGEVVFECNGLMAVPGFIQAHVHLSQSLFRGLADDLSLLDWLRRRILPLEASHSEQTLYDSVRLGCAELLLGGTTSVLDLAGALHVDASFEALKDSGIRAVSGKVLMDRGEIPEGLKGEKGELLKDTERLAKKYNYFADGRLRYAVIPRYIPACSPGLMKDSAEVGRELGLILHTHCAENEKEVALVRTLEGNSPVEFLHSIGWTGEDVSLTHCVYLSEREKKLIADSGTSIVHCPSANLKLASGIAPIREYVAAGINVAIGSDGAPCNNAHSFFRELRLCCLLAKVFPSPDPLGMDADHALLMAYQGGAKALGMVDKIGVIKEGACGDIVLIDPEFIPMLPSEGSGCAGRIVYSADERCIKAVIVAGRVVVKEGKILTMELDDVIDRAERSRKEVMKRAGI